MSIFIQRVVEGEDIIERDKTETKEAKYWEQRKSKNIAISIEVRRVFYKSGQSNQKNPRAKRRKSHEQKKVTT